MKNDSKNIRIFYLIVCAIAIVSLIPLVIASFYNHPSADDYSYAIRTYGDWSRTKSIPVVLLTAVKTSYQFWRTWQGLYSSAFFLALQPGIFGEQYYAITGLLMMFLIIASTTFFFVYLSKKFKFEKLYAIILGIIVSCFSIQYMPSVVEGLYWYNGAINYGLFYAALLIFICSSVESNLNSKKLPFVVSLFLIILLEGGNHVTAFMTIMFIIALILSSFLFKRRNYLKKNVSFLIVAICFFGFNVLSPGTSIRMGGYESTGFIKTIFLALKLGFEFIVTNTNLTTVSFILIIIPLAITITKKIPFDFRYPIVIAVLSYGVICMMMCPPIYVMGYWGDGRLIDIIYYSYILLLSVNAIYLIGYIQRKKSINLKPIVIYTLLIVSLLFVYIQREKAWGFIAKVELDNGMIERYDNEMQNRYEDLKDHEQQGGVLQLERLYTFPQILFFDEISERWNFWPNTSIAEYYGLYAVELK